MAKVIYAENSFERYLAKKLEDPEFRKLYERESKRLRQEIQNEFNKRKAKTS